MPCLTFRGNGASKARVFEAGGEEFFRAVLVSKGRHRIRPFPLKASHQVKDVALL